MPYKVDHSFAHHLTPMHDRPLTARQTYWLGCVAEAAALIERAIPGSTPGSVPVPVSAVMRADRARNDGRTTTTATGVIQILDALVRRRWLDAGEIPVEFRTVGGRRISGRGYVLADRSKLTVAASEMDTLRAQIPALEARKVRAARNLATSPRMEDEIEFHAARGGLIKINKRLVELEALAREQLAEAGDAHRVFQVPRELMLESRLVELSEQRAVPGAATPNPYAE